MRDAVDLLRVLVDRPAWMERAACKGMTDLFYPDGPGPAPNEARLICEGCQVIRHCLGAAVAGRELFGVWGGMAPRQRRRVRQVVLESIEEGSYL
jgi:WhiB family redox-sensing transcriptional regulator